MIFPKNRCVSISYVSCFYWMTPPWEIISIWLGPAVTTVCDCNRDEYHCLFECCRYKEIRKQLIHVVQNTHYSEAELTGSPTWCVELLLMPSCLDIFTNKQCQFYQQLLSSLPSLAAVFRMGFRQNFSGRRRHHVIAPAVLSLSRKHVDGWVTIYQ